VYVEIKEVLEFFLTLYKMAAKKKKKEKRRATA
jgi:hypothetical protein